MCKCALLSLLSIASMPAMAQSWQLLDSLAPLEPRRGEAVETHLPGDLDFRQWALDPELLQAEAGDRLETRDVVVEDVEIVKLSGLVPPIRFESGVADIPPDYVAQLREILAGMQHRRNVRLHLVGHADNQPLSPALAQVYGDNAGLSRERAGEVAEFFQAALGLPPESISYEWAGDSRPIAANASPAGRALNRRVEVEVWYDEPKEVVVQQEVLVAGEFKRVKVCRVETVCKLRYLEGHSRRARVRNLVAPLHWDGESATVPPEFIDQLRQSLHNMRDRHNIAVRFIGHADDQPLTGRAARIYGDPLSLSKARALRVALAARDALEMPGVAFESEGRGASRPLASNETAQGRATNRRVEVEFWYDDPLQDLPDEPQLCPEDAGAELVTRVYDPPWGRIPQLDLVQGDAIVPPGYTDMLRRALDDVADETNPRLRFVGYTANERLDRRTAMVYGDDVGLATARARRAMETLGAELGLESHQAEHEGRGYVHSEDVVRSGFLQGQDSYVVVQVVYDELAVLDDYEGVDVTRITRELRTRDAFGLNLMRIAVDGEPIDDPGRSSADVQRCTDVALERADMRFHFDSLEARPRLSVTAQPAPLVVPRAEPVDAFATPFRFRMYTNYASFIERAEVRLFAPGQSLQSAPLAAVEMDRDGLAVWHPESVGLGAPAEELVYVLRAYDAAGNFDQTAPRRLWMVRGEEAAAGEDAAAEADGLEQAALLAGYGESGLAVRNIELGSGTVRVHGTQIPPGHSVWIAGRPVPVDAEGAFVAEEILPAGLHTVEVAVLDEAGNGELFLRDLEVARSDWFYVGVADFTLSSTSSSSRADLLTGANAPYRMDSSADGRLAFYLHGKFDEHTRLVASADTREAPIGDLFSNFMDKSPEALFRRIDPDYYYPTFGDDGTVEEMAPTMGKFYVKVSRYENHALWGNFKIGYMNNELAQVDRGLYGANLHYQSQDTTGFGEQRLVLDGFAAEPGTVPSRDEFLGTGGSLYFMRRQDILSGSERVRIEVRDKDSGLVTAVLNLQPGADYDIDYLQGRILLSEPLSSTVDDRLLVRTGGLSGDEAWLVVRYEYTPGFEDLDALALGGQGHYWFNDAVKLGFTSSSSDDGDADSSLHAADLTLRKSTDTWVKLQAARSDGLAATTLRSSDGGFDFAGVDDWTLAGEDAGAYRADVSVGLDDFFAAGRGRVTVYAQSLDGGYSAPGQSALTDTQQVGGTVEVPLTERVAVSAKIDRRDQQDALETSAQEFNVGFKADTHWSVSAGVRRDSRQDRSPVVAPTQEEGDRTDAVVQLGYDSGARWRSYGFVQDTVSSSGSREDNGRVGVGGAWNFSERLTVDGEVSDGDLGAGARLGTNYLYSERTSLYLNYALQNERADNGLRQRRGNLVSGARSRLSDTTSVYLEERYQHSDTTAGLTHATGVSLAPSERWTLGVNADVGTLRDRDTAAETKRLAGGVRAGYVFEKLQLSSGVEFRNDDIQQADGSVLERTTWLFRNNLSYQVAPDWRLIGRLNHADSESSAGAFYDGGYTEAVIGYAFRPVRHDRLNALAKYTYFYNVPTTEQVTPQSTAAQFVQKSHIGALDLSYDLTAKWTIGAKYAYRLGQVSLERENPEFFDNSAHLVVLRADWHLGEGWEALLEGRVLDMPDLDERRSGALVGLYKWLGRNVKLGVGYNFTEFSDDLTDLNFNQQGAFINIVGVM
ncbi:OmpA family protein [Thioalkalivibrio sp. XN279]|uniref:OmpA family protein n=1 Tax=Thioalkalivibrio sp. XN279 TaxID=2714953 RepID=UPI001F0E0F21|nr:OmpA family protein [Thioalkalivibrio sp. XN279]